jgi:hypothetical protein
LARAGGVFPSFLAIPSEADNKSPSSSVDNRNFAMGMTHSPANRHIVTTRSNDV